MSPVVDADDVQGPDGEYGSRLEVELEAAQDARQGLRRRATQAGDQHPDARDPETGRGHQIEFELAADSRWLVARDMAEAVGDDRGPNAQPAEQDVLVTIVVDVAGQDFDLQSRCALC